MGGFILHDDEYCYAKYCPATERIWKSLYIKTLCLLLLQTKGNRRTWVTTLFGPSRDWVKRENYRTKSFIYFTLDLISLGWLNQNRRHTQHEWEKWEIVKYFVETCKWRNPLYRPAHCRCAGTVRSKTKPPNAVAELLNSGMSGEACTLTHISPCMREPAISQTAVTLILPEEGRKSNYFLTISLGGGGIRS
jgi:hypothetical protein